MATRIAAHRYRYVGGVLATGLLIAACFRDGDLLEPGSVRFGQVDPCSWVYGAGATDFFSDDAAYDACSALEGWRNTEIPECMEWADQMLNKMEEYSLNDYFNSGTQDRGEYHALVGQPYPQNGLLRINNYYSHDPGDLHITLLHEFAHMEFGYDDQTYPTAEDWAQSGMCEI